MMLTGAFVALFAVMSAAPYSLSVDNRVGKKAYLAAEVSSYAGKPAQGLRAGYFLTPDAILSLAHTRISADRDEAGFSGSTTDAGYKSFFSNSLYAEAGVSHQVWSGQDEEHNRTFSFVQAGNQWQWRAVTAGVDWLGYMVPVTGSAPVANDGAARFRFLRAYAGYAF